MSLPGSIPSGVNFELENQANEILRKGRAGVTRLEDKKFYLTEEQLKLRQDREVYNSNGVPDVHLVSGLYRRAFNPTAVSGARPRGIRVSEEWL